ncbi:MAG: hypothetical protein A3I01_13075 [Betaproteobacteria bacterium RIFCSPLOWO2_02_FULL_65_24]|nr:MAG: hypothetical protein A3I01_13075 [Betaproteobacteria bacterium RIFCSPLOWO2_02_FULL_65_24]
MAHPVTSDGVRLYHETTGSGTPVVFIHEFAGSSRSFDAQVRELRRNHRCIAFNARGYPPSDVPEPVDAYSQDRAVQDVIELLDALQVERAHLVGVSMGAAAALQVALKFPQRVLSAVLVSIGTGSDAPADTFQSSIEAIAALIDAQGMAGLAAHMSHSPGRRKLKEKNPEEFQRFIEQLSALSARGAANTMRGVQKRRAPVYVYEQALAGLAVPLLVVHGADDLDCRKPCEFIARTVPGAGLEIVPDCGHAVNLEEPWRFNRLCASFMDRVDATREKRG